MSMVKDVFFYNLDFYIKKRGLTKTSFARELGLKQTTISSWFSREAVPVDQLDQIANFFSIEVSELFTRDAIAAYDNAEKEVRDQYPNIDGKINPEIWPKLDLVTERYSYLFDGDKAFIRQEYVEMLGRVLPGIDIDVIELLKLADLKCTNEKNYHLACLFLIELVGEKGKETGFYKMMHDPEFEDELKLRKKQLFQLVSKLGPTKEGHSVDDKLRLLSPIEREHIEHLIDSSIAKQKSKQSVS